MFNLNNQVAIITGAGSGIGLAVSQKLASWGAVVTLIGKTKEKLEDVRSSISSPNDIFPCDVQDEQALKAVRKSILSKHGKIDILVTCAAAPGVVGKLENTTIKEWRSVLDTDLDGVFLCCKTFGAVMVKNRYGRIVNMTSFHNIGTYPERVIYNTAKSGVEGLSRGLAVEWGSYGITVNTVAPGPIRTPRTSWFLSQSPDVETGMLGRTPNIRLGETEEVADLIAFLVTDEARHINGHQIVIDGGWTKSAWWGDYTGR